MIHHTGAIIKRIGNVLYVERKSPETITIEVAMAHMPYPLHVKLMPDRNESWKRDYGRKSKRILDALRKWL